MAEAPPSPARPALPRLVQVHEVPRFDNSPLPVNAHMLHNLAHVELNAIDLAWDTVVRYSHLYPTMPLGAPLPPSTRSIPSYTYTAAVCASSLVEGPFSVAPRHSHRVLRGLCACGGRREPPPGLVPAAAGRAGPRVRRHGRAQPAVGGCAGMC